MEFQDKIRGQKMSTEQRFPTALLFSFRPQGNSSKTASPSGMPKFRDPTVAIRKKLQSLGNKHQDGIPQSAQGEPIDCNCQRPACIIICTSCGHHFHGRVRRRCPAHPSQIFLMDNDICPTCSAGSLREHQKDHK